MAKRTIPRTEIGKRVCELLDNRGWVQRRLAAEIGVSQAQISEWVRGGKERPSAKHLISMGNLAEAPLNLWFWRVAGINLKQIAAANDGKAYASIENFRREVDLSRRDLLFLLARVEESVKAVRFHLEAFDPYVEGMPE